MGAQRWATSIVENLNPPNRVWKQYKIEAVSHGTLPSLTNISTGNTRTKNIASSNELGLDTTGRHCVSVRGMVPVFVESHIPSISFHESPCRFTAHGEIPGNTLAVKWRANACAVTSLIHLAHGTQSLRLKLILRTSKLPLYEALLGLSTLK